ncbi:unnamed protein product [Closterium sp. NIES-65]|nr:unnamed protein product [Closterium sp. NIES-65]
MSNQPSSTARLSTSDRRRLVSLSAEKCLATNGHVAAARRCHLHTPGSVNWCRWRGPIGGYLEEFSKTHLSETSCSGECDGDEC